MEANTISKIGLERFINPCPVVDCEDYERYPLASEEEFNLMKSEVKRLNKFAQVFIYVRSVDSDPYVEIYVWDEEHPYRPRYTRFIICNGMCLSEELEDKLLWFTKNVKLLMRKSDMSISCSEIACCFSEWHYPDYGTSGVGMALEHLYFASHRSGPKEILYKANLGAIAYNLDLFNSYNVIGTTPQEIIGHGVQLKLLRILNQMEFIEFLLYEESLIRSIAVYSCFSGYIDSYPSLAQWLYLEGLYVRAMTDNEDFDRQLYDKLRKVNLGWVKTKIMINKVFCFIELRNELGAGGKIEFPELDEMDYEISRLGSVKDPKLVKLFEERAEEEAGKYEYHDDHYQVVFPKTPFDMFYESLELKNCLAWYIAAHAYSGVTILFVHERNKPEKPFVAVEVRDGKIVQARAKRNETPELPARYFLALYAKAHDLKMTMDIFEDFF